MRYYPEDEYDLKNLERLNAEDWMIELLKKNPSYCSWGNGEDYMCSGDQGWNSNIEISSVDDLWGLDDYNELVNFYFKIHRKHKNCTACKDGYNKETEKISKAWYGFENPSEEWCHKITQDEVDELWGEGRLRSFKEKPTADEVNQWSKTGMGHDACNKFICVRARAEKLGVYGSCEECDGHLIVYTAPKAKIGLQMWMLHPRKGASRGVFLKNIEEHEVPRVIEYLKEARDRNSGRFSKL